MKVNLNDQCIFTLTEAGAKVWNAAWDLVPVNVRPNPKQAGDVLTSQLWVVMEIFGPHTDLGQSSPHMVDNTLEICL